MKSKKKKKKKKKGFQDIKISKNIVAIYRFVTNVYII